MKKVTLLVLLMLLLASLFSAGPALACSGTIADPCPTPMAPRG